MTEPNSDEIPAAQSLSQLSQLVRQQTGEALGKFSHILQQVADGVLLTTTTGAIEYANPAFEHIAGYGRDELVGRIPEWLAPSTQNAAMWAALRTGEPFRSTCATSAKNGQHFHLQYTVNPIRNEAGDLAQLIIVCKDISSQVRAEEERRQLEQSLMQAERMAAVGTVAAGIVHNLRGYLQSIVAYGELLRMEHPDLSELDHILDSSQQMNQLIEDILDKSRQRKTRETIDINVLLQRELDFLQANPVFKHEVEKDVRLGEDLPPIQGVYSDLSQVFGNLLRNAVDAMHQRPVQRLSLSSHREASYAVVEVSDSGCGISEEHRARLFDPFFTTKSADAARGEPIGTGLGLFTVSRLLESMNATLELQSTVDVRTTFRISLPLAG